MPRRARAILLATIATLLASCVGNEIVCVEGDRLGCRCGDGTYGYLTCNAAGHYDTDAGCDCVNTLTPDASR
jgi:hypothetical protein